MCCIGNASLLRLLLFSPAAPRALMLPWQSRTVLVKGLALPFQRPRLRGAVLVGLAVGGGGDGVLEGGLGVMFRLFPGDPDIFFIA